MSLQLPCRMSYGEKLDDADCYADLFLFNGGDFLLNFAIRSRATAAPAAINVGFALFDADGAPLGGRLFGMDDAQACVIEPLHRGFPPERHDSIAWNLPPALLAAAEKVAVSFRHPGQAPDWKKLGHTAARPTALHLGGLAG